MKQIKSNLTQVVELLSNSEYVDGTTIGSHLNITRAAVWKIIKKLEQYSIGIDSQKGLGYKLQAPLTLLDQSKIKKHLKHRNVELEVFEKTESTNGYLKTKTTQNKKIIACFAEQQTAGKGRLERQWHSPFGHNIYMSLLYPFNKDISELSGLSLVVALAVCEALENIIDFGKNKLEIKWPNDILVNGEKLAGILIELDAESHGYCQAVIGLGINVNMRQAKKKHINQLWTSVSKVTEQYTDRNLLGAALIDSLAKNLDAFAQHGFAYFQKEWKKRDYLYGSNIIVQQHKNKISGKCQGINNQGHLKLTTNKNEKITLASGDATLLK